MRAPFRSDPFAPAGPRHHVAPLLPPSRGPLSDTVIKLLCERAPCSHLTRIETPLGDADPFGVDLQLALYLCYELHYRGFVDVDPLWEWDGALLHLRGRMETVFLDAVRSEVGTITADDDPTTEIDKLSTVRPGSPSVSAYLRDGGTWAQMQEFFVHRSLYHLKEGDPHAWVIPRLTGQAKASFVAVEFDEYGAGHGRNVHQELFADLLEAAGLDHGYLAYLDAVAAETLAVVNVMSLFSLHRGLRGAAVGHFAATEITSPPGAYRLVEALRRLRAPQPCVRFYAEHVEADAVHEQVVRTDVIDNLLLHEPQLASDVVFGMRAFVSLENRLEHLMLDSWNDGRSSLQQLQR
ncbi:iron-containing redox enzyme family protein [Mycolicibacterium llatzerense]|uniref:iron-containing redox enzyme family protein n=1 Tax=Mycolicibacterium llatzerense TaxID=280871 RepID=UPI0021B6713E|nr:iron-containing redox enzyme family protein [Mycolicibacterium llatzerense]MCT7367991.1 hypothetical protein [Mycolicibacterium llatzerense]